MSLCCAVPYPCIVNASVTSLTVFVLSFLLFYWLPSRPRIVVARLYTVKEDGSIKPVEPHPLPPEKQRVVEEKIKVLEEELKREAVQKLTEEWRRNPKLRLRRALVWAGSFAIGIFIASYLSCRLSICPQCVP